MEFDKYKSLIGDGLMKKVIDGSISKALAVKELYIKRDLWDELSPSLEITLADVNYASPKSSDVVASLGIGGMIVMMGVMEGSKADENETMADAFPELSSENIQSRLEKDVQDMPINVLENQVDNEKSKLYNEFIKDSISEAINKNQGINGFSQEQFDTELKLVYTLFNPYRMVLDAASFMANEIYRKTKDLEVDGNPEGKKTIPDIIDKNELENLMFESMGMSLATRMKELYGRTGSLSFLPEPIDNDQAVAIAKGLYAFLEESSLSNDSKFDFSDRFSEAVDLEKEKLEEYYSKLV